MTHDELDQTLDRMFKDAVSPEDQPGAVTVQTDDWLGVLSTARATCATLQNGLRYRDIRILVSSQFETQVLSRAEAGDRGEPYRELRDRTESDVRPRA
ncbi:MAG: hypothetical protein DI624_01910 [Brevundimonas sp.]|uniref:hypothetical protein n=1 Tax=Brevundimonas sp. TaxID=1871086 RepID=UPI000DB4BAEA|nr:hypothetical protein [Brevundimonas sp.]PZU00559.1 MAG: hypothetical protein DI624_01910 [Brevundimonas sp.]